jgi:hypothetical protein
VAERAAARLGRAAEEQRRQAPREEREQEPAQRLRALARQDRLRVAVRRAAGFRLAHARYQPRTKRQRSTNIDVSLISSLILKGRDSRSGSPALVPGDHASRIFA